MRILIQRVKFAAVEIEGKEFSSIGKGLLAFFCAEEGDREGDLDYFANKILKLRIFEDERGKMGLSLVDVGGEILVVSQFTLAANCKKGARPSFEGAMEPAGARRMYEKFVERVDECYGKLLEEKGFAEGCASGGVCCASGGVCDGVKRAKTGVFGADMQVKLLNDGPVTIILETPR